MPIFLLRCDRCGREDEVIRLASAAAEIARCHGEPCPVMGCGGTMRTVPAPIAIRFRGSGWTAPAEPIKHHHEED